MGAGIGIHVVASPAIEMKSEVMGKSSSSGKGTLANEDDRYHQLLSGEALLPEPGEVGEVLGDDDPLLLDGQEIEVLVRSLGHANLEHPHRIVPEVVQLGCRRGWEHLIDEPPHRESSRSRCSIMCWTC